MELTRVWSVRGVMEAVVEMIKVSRLDQEQWFLSSLVGLFLVRYQPPRRAGPWWSPTTRTVLPNDSTFQTYLLDSETRISGKCLENLDLF